MKEPKASIDLITPAIATKLLDTYNFNNRNMTENKVQYYEKLMRENRFKLTSDAIALSDEHPLMKRPRLINGQHRLMALIRSGTSQKFIVIRDLPDNTFEVIDTGKNRTAGDVLSSIKVDNPGRLATMSKFIIAFQSGQYYNAINADSRGAKTISNVQVKEFVLKNLPALKTSMQYGYDKNNKLVPAATLGALHYILSGVNKKRADDFITAVVDGVDIKRDSPVFMLRGRLDDNSRALHKLSSREVVALLIKTWNAFYDGVQIEKLRFAKERDEFPLVKGLKKTA